MNQCKDSDKLKKEGNDAIAQHCFSDAVNFYSLAPDLNPCNYSAFHNRSIAYFNVEEWGKSIADASACLVGEPNSTEARGMAQMMQSLEKLSINQALCDFEQSLSFQPPRDQMVVLVAKIEKCKTILSSKANEPQTLRLNDFAHTAEEKKKVRA